MKQMETPKMDMERLKQINKERALFLERTRYDDDMMELLALQTKYHKLFCHTVTLSRNLQGPYHSSRLQVRNIKNAMDDNLDRLPKYKYSNKVKFYTTECTLGSPIRNAVNGCEYKHVKVGNYDDEMSFFKISLSFGVHGSNVVGKHVYYNSPEQYEEHFFTVLDKTIKDKWYSYQRDIYHQEVTTRSMLSKRDLIKKIKKIEFELDHSVVPGRRKLIQVENDIIDTDKHHYSSI